MPRSKTNIQYDLRLPGEVYRHFRLKSQAEAQSLSGLLRGIIMREYNSRITGEKTGLPVIAEVGAGPKHQVTLPVLVHQHYKGMADRAEKDLSVILRSIIVEAYREETGLVVEDRRRLRKPGGLDSGKWRGLVRGTEERPLVKRKRGRPRKAKKD